MKDVIPLHWKTWDLLIICLDAAALCQQSTFLTPHRSSSPCSWADLLERRWWRHTYEPHPQSLDPQVGTLSQLVWRTHYHGRHATGDAQRKVLAHELSPQSQICDWDQPGLITMAHNHKLLWQATVSHLLQLTSTLQGTLQVFTNTGGLN